MEILAIISVLGVLFIILHLRPLNEGEITSIASKWRAQELQQYFCFEHSVWDVDPRLKSGMPSAGGEYTCNTPLKHFPSIAASMLKYKKHEWLVLGFEREQSIVSMYVNKGNDNKSVGFYISAEEIVRTARANGCTSVLILHNHPNPNPSMYTTAVPSEADLAGAYELACHFSHAGLNLIEYVCERGIPYEYYRYISDEFRSISSYVPSIRSVSGISPLLNLRLHVAMRYGATDFRRVVTKMQSGLKSQKVHKQTTGLPAAGWYSDPEALSELRYWDGAQWSEYVANNSVVGIQPLGSQQ